MVSFNGVDTDSRCQRVEEDSPPCCCFFVVVRHVPSAGVWRSRPPSRLLDFGIQAACFYIIRTFRRGNTASARGTDVFFDRYPCCVRPAVDMIFSIYDNTLK